jgi:hypothetical protein
MEQPRTDWNGHPYASALFEIASAEAKLRAATERRRRLVQEVMSKPEADRPTVSDVARALGLPRMSVHQLAKSSPTH